MTMASTTCPVCCEAFDTSVAFALHVATCTAPVEAGAPSPATTTTALAAAALATPTASCPLCHMVYTNEMAPHEIAFHEEECERVNEFTGPVGPLRLDVNGGIDGTSGRSGRPSSGSKRSREHVDTTSATATGPQVKLFPTHCAVCDAGGRALLHCAGTCARSFHPLCIEEMNVARDFSTDGLAPIVMSAASMASASGGSVNANVSFATAITRDKKAQNTWVCGECTRGLHTCQLCGFLGHEGHEIVRCSLPDCGFFFHPACLREQNQRAVSPLVCPRHTCTACHAIETDMTVVSSCTKCCTSIHLRCRDATSEAATSSTQTRGRGDVLDPHFHVCEAHRATSSITPERKAAQYPGLKMHSRPGDVVLILEYGNLLLPSSAKAVAPAAYNQWGVVQRAENLGDGISSAWWTQLLTVTLFSDNSTISVPNRYVLPIGSMRQYTSPVHMVRDAIKWHAMSEVHVRHLEKRRSGTTASTTSVSTELGEAVLAFKERAKALGLSSADCLTDANHGYTEWLGFTGSSSQTFAKTSAPVYVALDTRGQHKPDLETATGSERDQKHTRGPHKGTSGDDDDVEMEDSSSTSGQDKESSASTQASLSGSMETRTTAHAMDQDSVEKDIVEVMTRLLEGVEAEVMHGSLLDGSSLFQSSATVDSPSEITASAMEEDDKEDVEMVTVELPPLDDEEDSNSDEDCENRLSMDDLLNPMSQESVASTRKEPPTLQKGVPSPLSSPLRADNQITESVMDASVLTQKRTLDDTEAKSMDDSSISDTNGSPTSLDQVRTNKKPKLVHDSKPTIAVKFTHLPLNLKAPRGSVFGRVPLPLRPALKQKEQVAIEYPNLMLRNLKSQVDAFFEAEDNYDGRHLKSLSSFRPAFYRPTPFLYRSARVGRRLDPISRILLCQDKRNLKCFVRVGTSSSSTTSKSSKPLTCPYSSAHDGRIKYVSLDLIGISNFSTLEREVRCRVATAVATKERSPGWHWHSSTGTNVTVEEEVREPEIRLTYCAYDGSEHVLPRHSMHRQQQPEWLCFCANVVHLTATVIQE